MKSKLFLVLLSGVMVWLPLAGAAELSVDFTFAPADVELTPADEYTVVGLTDGSRVVDEAGAPSIPAKFANILLPSGAQNISVSASGDWMLLAEGITPYPAQPRNPKSRARPAFVPANDRYASAEAWPSAVATYQGDQDMQGYQFVSVRVNPLSYVGAEKKLYLRETVTVTVTYDAAPVTKSILPKQASVFGPLVDSLVVNPSDASAFAPAVKTVAPKAALDYLIITSTSLSNAFQQIANYRSSAVGGSYSTRVITTDTIGTDYTGADIQAKIRACISNSVATLGTTMVLLGGDDTIVLDRNCKVSVGSDTESEMPTDLYYSGLGGSWDGDGDSTYGETSDSVDMAWDVIVGRLPMRTATQVTNYLNKVMTYESGSPVTNKIILGGPNAWDLYTGTDRPSDDVTIDGHAGFRSTSPSHTSVSDSEAWLRRLYRDGIRSYWPAQVGIICDSITSWDGSTCGDHVESEANTVAAFNQNWTHLMFSGHGAPQEWGLESGYFDDSNASSMTGMTAFVYTDACLTGHFDKNSNNIDGYNYTTEPCLAEGFLRNTRALGGALAYMGCARYGWGSPDDAPASNTSDGGPSTVYAYKFYKRMFETSGRTLGLAFAMHKADMISSSGTDDCERWIQFGMNLLGDPALKMPTGTTTPTAPIFTSGTNYSTTTGVVRTFTVIASGNPTPALSLLSSTATSGSYGFTNATGVLSYTAPTNDVGTKTFTFRATNTMGVATQVVSVTVNSPPAPALDAFEWDTVSSPQAQDVPFLATLTAKDQYGATFTGYASNATLSAPASATGTVGAGTTAWTYPMQTYYHDARTQVIYLQSELGGATILSGLALNVSVLPGQALNNWTLRMKHTALSTHSSAVWEGPASGWTTVFQGNETVSGTGWVWFQFTTPFSYNGTDNLMVDYSHNNTSYTTDGQVLTTIGSAGQALVAHSDSDDGDPLDWIASSPTPISTNRVPNIRLLTEQDIAMSPSATGSFTNGVWSGMITVEENVSDVKLRASNGGATGDSNVFDVDGDPPPAAPASIWASVPNVTGFTAMWSSVSDADSYRLDVGTNATFVGGGASTQSTLSSNAAANTTPPADWTYNISASSSSYLILGYASNAVVSEAFSTVGLTNLTVDCQARTYGGTAAGTTNLTVSISGDDGTNWTTIGVVAPADNSMAAMPTLATTANLGTSQTRIRWQALGASANKGVGIQVLVTKGWSTGGAPAYVAGYSNLTVSGTSQSVTGLVAESIYYFRARAVNGVGTSGDSSVANVTTLAEASSDQTITFGAIADQLTTDTVNLSASASSGLTVTFVVGSGSASISGDTSLTFSGAGSVSIVASQAGDGSWNPAPDVTNTFTVSKALATVTLSDLSRMYDGTPKSATATTTPTGLVVNLTYEGSGTAPSAVGTYELICLVSDTMYAGGATDTFSIVTVTNVFEEWVTDEGEDPVDPDYAPDEDIDGDGATTWEEFLADTDPSESSSCLVLTGAYTIATGGGSGDIVLAFPASPNRYYQLEYCTGLAEHLVGTNNLGWGQPGMAVTNSSTGTWYGVIRALLQEP